MQKLNHSIYEEYNPLIDEIIILFDLEIIDFEKSFLECLNIASKRYGICGSVVLDIYNEYHVKDKDENYIHRDKFNNYFKELK